MSQTSVFRFSTTEIPERDRVAVFREVFGPCAAIDITPLGGECRAEIEWHVLPGAGVLWSGNSAHRFMWGGNIPRRIGNSGDLGKSDDDCVITWAMKPALYRQLGKEATVDAGSAVLMSCVDKAMVEHPLAMDYVTLKLPRSTLKPLVGGLEDAFMRAVPAETDALRLLNSYLATLRTYQDAGSELRRAMVLHICDLIALAFGTTRDVAELAGRRGLRAARLEAVKTDINANLTSRDLSVAAVALRQGVTPRYVHMLFDGEGTTFSQYVLSARLAYARRMLLDPSHAHQSIGAIAYASGFGDLSHFNHAFRRRYGATPSEVRRERAR